MLSRIGRLLAAREQSDTQSVAAVRAGAVKGASDEGKVEGTGEPQPVFRQQAGQIPPATVRTSPGIQFAIDAIDTGASVVYPTDACSDSTEEYENMATAMMEFASPTHTTVMTLEEYTALRQA